jgi:hypothetical protein
MKVVLLRLTLLLLAAVTNAGTTLDIHGIPSETADLQLSFNRHAERLFDLVNRQRLDEVCTKSLRAIYPNLLFA